MIVKITGADKKLNIASYVEKKNADLPKFVEELAETVRSHYEENIKLGRGVDGGGLRPLKPETIKAKREKYGYTDILQATRKLLNSIKKRKRSDTHWEVYCEGDRDEVLTYQEKMGRKVFGLGNFINNKLRDKIRVFFAS